MTILLPNIASLLPSASPWETAGGHNELATVIFLRGAILSSYGFVETQLNEIAIRSSRLKIYNDLNPKFPWKFADRMKYLTKAFSTEGVLKEHAPSGRILVEDFIADQKNRNKWAHGALSVLPGGADQRWTGAWITLKNFDPKNNEFEMSNDRWLSSEIIEQVHHAKSLADRSNEIHCSLFHVLPEI